MPGMMWSPVFWWSDRKIEEHFESPEHAINVIRRMLHVSGMVLDDASQAFWDI